MKILVEVIIPTETDFRKDIEAWDVYGCAQALDDEMTLFSIDSFAIPTNGRIATSVKDNRFKWVVTIRQSTPIIIFWNSTNQTELARITGAPIEQGAVKAILEKIVNPYKTIKTVGAGLGLLGLALFVAKKQKPIRSKRLKSHSK